MKVTSLNVSGVLGVRHVDMQVTSPITMFVGANGAGKSSLQESIRMALTGETVRVSLKKEYASLVHESEKTGVASVGTDSGEYAIAIPSGKASPVNDPSLIFALDAQRFPRLDDNSRRSFLYDLMQVKTDGQSVAQRLIDRGCDEELIKSVTPLLRVGFEPAAKEAQAKARELKALWRSVTGEAYGEKKAEIWEAALPEADFDQAAFDQAAGELATASEQLNKLNSEAGRISAEQAEADRKRKKIAELDELGKRYARIQEKLIRDEAELAQWQQKVTETFEKANGSNATACVCPCCNESLVWLNGKLVPEAEGKKSDPEAAAKLPEYEKALDLLIKAVANDKRDLAAADAAANQVLELQKELENAPSELALDDIQSQIDATKQAMSSARERLSQLDAVKRQHDEAAQKTTAAKAHHEGVLAWDKIAESLSPDGIPAELLAEAIGPLNGILADYSYIAGWAEVVIHRDMQITAGNRAYALLSESEKWRVDTLIAAAISRLAGCKILVLDRFDVLDNAGREDLVYLLTTLVNEGQLNNAFVFGTLKSLPSIEGVDAHWLENGELQQLQKAA